MFVMECASGMLGDIVALDQIHDLTLGGAVRLFPLSTPSPPSRCFLPALADADIVWHCGGGPLASWERYLQRSNTMELQPA
jgi:hypothetical protein